MPWPNFNGGNALQPAQPYGPRQMGMRNALMGQPRWPGADQPQVRPNGAVHAGPGGGTPAWGGQPQTGGPARGFGPTAQPVQVAPQAAQRVQQQPPLAGVTPAGNSTVGGGVGLAPQTVAAIRQASGSPVSQPPMAPVVPAGVSGTWNGQQFNSAEEYRALLAGAGVPTASNPNSAPAPMAVSGGYMGPEQLQALQAQQQSAEAARLQAIARQQQIDPSIAAWQQGSLGSRGGY